METGLTMAERDELAECEEIIAAGLREFIKVGNALLKIRDRKLYRANHESFESYCKDRWGFASRRGYQLIKAAETVQNLQLKSESENECVPMVHSSNTAPQPTHERQIRPLTDLEPDLQREAWQEATNGNSNPTAAQVQKAADKVKVRKIRAHEAQSADPAERTGQPAKPEDSIPAVLTRSIIGQDMLVRGYAVSSDVNGEPCALPIGVSKLERDECVATMIGGSEAFKDRKAYYKWEAYKEQKIRAKILKVLSQIGPLEIPKGHKVAAVRYTYDLNVSTDLQELAEMLYADLSRCASALANKEKYGHLVAPPSE
jgi:hypothetical protein